MTDMIETVARAIQNDDGSPCISTMRLGLCKQADGCVCRSLARAALLALREPTGEMRASGRDAIQPYVGRGLSRPVQHQWQIADETWEAMINAALETKGGGE